MYINILPIIKVYNQVGLVKGLIYIFEKRINPDFNELADYVLKYNIKTNNTDEALVELIDTIKSDLSNEYGRIINIQTYKYKIINNNVYCKLSLSITDDNTIAEIQKTNKLKYRNMSNNTLKIDNLRFQDKIDNNDFLEFMLEY